MLTAGAESTGRWAIGRWAERILFGEQLEDLFAPRRAEASPPAGERPAPTANPKLSASAAPL